ncbi:MAG TPA: hypothetical protein VI356_21010 [Myxococcales bacterium]
MRKAVLALLLLGAGCSNNDTLILGGIGASSETPQIVFDNINSAISGKVTLSDANGNPVTPVLAVILSDSPGLCDKLKQHPDYFRKPPETFIAMILFIPPDKFGTFLPGRQGDEGTGSEIIGVSDTSKKVLPFRAVDGDGFIAIAPENGTTGSFNLLYAAPPELNVTTSGFPFQGRFKAGPCPNMANVLLP